MNDGFRVQRSSKVEEYFFPVDRISSIAHDDLLSSSNVILVKFIKCGHVVCGHEVLDLSRFVPAPLLHFITSDMEQIVDKNASTLLAAGHLTKEGSNDIPSQITAGVDWYVAWCHRARAVAIRALVVPSWKNIRVSNTPSPRVTRCIEFRNNANTSVLSIADNVSQVGLSIPLLWTPCTFPQLWVGFGFNREALCVNNVPVHDVQFSVADGIDNSLDNIHRQVMARCVYQHSSVWELGKVINCPWCLWEKIRLKVVVKVNELSKGFQASQSTVHCVA
mmetsp:Transcript_3192/g.4385  ORF Transcript_3192/g.4385 Transcript_3192/m.4385 type:complete len:277 (-) Transcript_3192:643-1473(-)